MSARRIAAGLAFGWAVYAVGGQLLAARIHHIPVSVEQVLISAVIWAAYVAVRWTVSRRFFGLTPPRP